MTPPKRKKMKPVKMWLTVTTRGKMSQALWYRKVDAIRWAEYGDRIVRVLVSEIK